MDEATRQQAKGRMKRIAGQVAGIERMIDDDRYCIEILNQIAAVRSALDNLGVQLLTDHIEHCVIGGNCDGKHPQAQNRTQEELLAEIETALSRFLR